MCIIYQILIIFFQILLFYIRLQRCSASDCLEAGDRMFDDGSSNSTLVSPGEVFELGFFTPDGSSRYLGIWYYNEYNPNSVIWVANRNKSLRGYTDYLIVNRNHAELLDEKNSKYWSTNDLSQMQPLGISNVTADSNVSYPNELVHLSYVHMSNGSIYHQRNGTVTARSMENRTRRTTRLCLTDNGNLILKDPAEFSDSYVLWQSFGNPTDTYLPGRTTYESVILTSWRDYDDPAEGEFRLLLQPGAPKELIVIKRGLVHFWESGITPFDAIPSGLSELLVSPVKNFSDTRLVINHTGQIQYWQRNSQKSWSLVWTEPKDQCSLYNVCGKFGSCSSDTGRPCKCLPGFMPSELWKSGDYTGGCNPKSGSPADRNSRSNDIFLKLPLLKVGNKTCSASTTDENCTAQCIKDPNCVAYFYGMGDCSDFRTSSLKKCLMWSGELTDLQEDYHNGITLYVRTAASDIDPTPRLNCRPCGTYIIPYPLSTGAVCGDSSYFHFHCNDTVGQVNFFTPRGSFKVTVIDPDAKAFYIHVTNVSNCDFKIINSFIFSPSLSLPFEVRNCTIIKDQPLVDAEQPFIEVEMGWLPPPEFACNTNSDCRFWAHTSCKEKDRRTRCFCRPTFHWDGLKLQCTRVHFVLKVVASCIAGGFVCLILCAYYIWKQIISQRKRQDSIEFQDDDGEDIDVPFFDWGSLLAATNNFADANKLGEGGFGSVYGGKLQDGKKIAVKRLSSVSVQGVEEFRTEVKLIAKLQHRNLVRLLGYCVKAGEKMLVYEYMPNGSLDSCLFDETFSVTLDWEQRFDVIFGIARGLLYLHQDSRLRIIHRDLKPSNILLDEDLNPKIADFGIARIVEGKQTESSTIRVVGTFGYMSPEYVSEGVFSVKSDVYSFGVVVLETVSGRRNSRIFMLEHGVSLLIHAWKLWTAEGGLDLIDPALIDACNQSEVLKCIHVALLCVQEDPTDRPTISTVVLMLSSDNVSLPTPGQPAFSTAKPQLETGSSSGAANTSFSEMMTFSTVGR